MQDRNEAAAPELSASWPHQSSDSGTHSETRSDAGTGSESPHSQFDGLAANYAALMAELSHLGGKLGAENLSDQIWEQLQSIAETLAVMRGESYAHLIVKLRISFDFMEENLDPALRALVQSAIADLHWLEAR